MLTLGSHANEETGSLVFSQVWRLHGAYFRNSMWIRQCNQVKSCLIEIEKRPLAKFFVKKKKLIELLVYFGEQQDFKKERQIF